MVFVFVVYCVYCVRTSTVHTGRSRCERAPRAWWGGVLSGAEHRSHFPCPISGTGTGTGTGTGATNTSSHPYWRWLCTCTYDRDSSREGGLNPPKWRVRSRQANGLEHRRHAARGRRCTNLPFFKPPLHMQDISRPARTLRSLMLLSCLAEPKADSGALPVPRLYQTCLDRSSRWRSCPLGRMHTSCRSPSD